MISKHAFPSSVYFAGPHSMHCPMKLRSLWCPPAGLGANKRCQIICDPSTLARLASAAVEPRKNSSLAQSYERRGSGPNFAAALRASNHVNVRKTNAPQSRRAATATDVTDCIDCCGHDRTIHQPLARRSIGRSGGCIANQHWQRSIFFLLARPDVAMRAPAASIGDGVVR